MQKRILGCLFGAAFACAATGIQAQADHLLFSEVGIAPSAQQAGYSAEYVEIYNPTAAPVELENYYITDRYDYMKFPATPAGIDGGATDNIFKFPAGSVLEPGQYAVVTGSGLNFLNSFFGQNTTYNDFREALPGQPLLFEVGESDDAIPNMSYFNLGATPSNLNFTNPSETNGEFIVMFYWDGDTDLVQDVDIVTWGNSNGANFNRFIPKTAADTGRNDTPYLPDAGDHANLSVGNTGFQLITRVSMTETGEVLTGGNGINGHDETTEDVSLTWVGGNFNSGDATPGYSLVGLASAQPVIASVVRDVKYPAPGDNITITVTASDSDGLVESVTVYVRTDVAFDAVAAVEGDPGVWTADIGSFADGTVVDYYVTATDDTGVSGRFPRFFPANGLVTGFHVTEDPMVSGDVIVNEILHDNPGGDTFEFVELYNKSSQPVDLSYFGFADKNHTYGKLARGAVIPPNGYMVLSMDLTDFFLNYPRLPGVKYYDWGTFALNQGGGDTMFLAHANEFGSALDEHPPTSFVEEVTYLDTAPWPTGHGGSLRSMELKHPDLNNTLGENWAVAIDIATPGARNSVFTVGAIIGNVTRDAEFPAPNSPIVISADVTHSLGTIAAVRAMVDTGSSFAPFPMTAWGTDGNYTVELPGFADGTVVRFYIEAEDSNAIVVTDPMTAPDNYHVFIVDADPPVPGDLVINEILYDHPGPDTYEFVEIHNNTDSEISLAYFRVSDPTSNYFVFPADAVIAPRGFVVLTMSESRLTMQYDIPAEVPLYEVAYILNNPSDTVYMVHPNSLGFKGVTTYLDYLTYSNTAPWPQIDGNATGQSIELLSPNLDNSQGQNWAASIELGTPGLANTAVSSVADWNLY